MKIFVIIPLHNEKRHIRGVLKGLSGYNLPVVVVDDGSIDNSGLEVKRLDFKNVTLLTHKINLGKGSSMKTGAEYAWNSRADAVVFMDADGQHNTKDLQRFIEALESRKYEVIFGSRNLSMGVPLVRYLGNKIASIIVSLLFGSYVSDAICGFRAITKKAYQKIEWESNGYGVEIEMIARVGKYKMKFTEVPVETIYLDGVKGVTLLDAFGILGEVVKWRLTL
jgi:glycosyltransferase involved in cell wall biosynthesis